MVDPKPMPDIDDHVKITKDNGDWDKKKVAAIGFEKSLDRYHIAFTDTTGLVSQEEEWGYDPPSGFVPVNLEIIHHSYSY